MIYYWLNSLHMVLVRVASYIVICQVDIREPKLVQTLVNGLQTYLGSHPLLFNIFINDLFLALTDVDVCSFADDNSIYCCNKSLETVITSLESGVQSCLTKLVP